MECTNCGNDVLASVQFCGTCGASVRFDLTEVTPTNKGRLSFTRAVMLGLDRSFDYKGRSSRAEYWWWILFYLGSSFAVAVIFTMLSEVLSGSEDPGVVFAYVYTLILMLPYIALTTRRLHDTGRSGFWCLFMLLPYVGFLILLGLCALKGEKGLNKYDTVPSGFEK